MPAGVRVLCPESRSEGVNLWQSEAEGLHIELARDGEKSLFAEKILLKVYVSAAGLEWLMEIVGISISNNPTGNV